jgi:phosphohistidine phosphatase
VRKLYLLRHAKSSWDEPELADSKRPLAPRGRRAAALIADHMRGDGLSPELVICSPAVRARQTLDGLGDAIGSARIELADDIYDAHESDLLERIRKVPDAIDSVLMIGHNPSIQRLTLLLATESDLLDDARAKFPTAALATLAIDRAHWSDVHAGDATLEGFVKPRDLEG